MQTVALLQLRLGLTCFTASHTHTTSSTLSSSAPETTPAIYIPNIPTIILRGKGGGGHSRASQSHTSHYKLNHFRSNRLVCRRKGVLTETTTVEPCSCAHTTHRSCRTVVCLLLPCCLGEVSRIPALGGTAGRSLSSAQARQEQTLWGHPLLSYRGGGR